MTTTYDKLTGLFFFLGKEVLNGFVSLFISSLVKCLHGKDA